MKAIFITGTDTDIGKTVVSSWLALHWHASYWKPIQSGLDAAGIAPSDRQTAAQLAHCHTFPERYTFKAALSPHEAARQENIAIYLHEINLPIWPEGTQANARLVVEGAGGLLAPLNNTHSIADLILKLELPTIIVARSAVGTINHTRLTIEAAQRRNITVLGVIMVGPPTPSNQTAIEHFTGTPVLATLPRFNCLSHDALKNHPMPSRLVERRFQAVNRSYDAYYFLSVFD
jgi:dethiobiotin synthetase/malonyl-CoA O-methyltransferase